MKKKSAPQTRLSRTKGRKPAKRFEEELDASTVGVLLLEARRRKSITQEELADKIGTTKHYISRVEHGATDIRVSTLLRIVQLGLGGKVSFSMEN